MVDNNHAFLVASHHEGLPEVGFRFHRPLQLVHWVNLELLMITLSSSLNTYANAHVSLKRYGLVHENFYRLLHISIGHFNPNWRYWSLLNRLIYLLRFFQHDDVRLLVQLDLFKNHFLEALHLSAYFDLDLHDVVWIIRLKVVTALLFLLLIRDVLLVLLWFSFLDLLVLFLDLWLLLSWFLLSNFFFSFLIWFLLHLFKTWNNWLWYFRILSEIRHVTSSEILLNKVQLDGLNDLYFFHRGTFCIRVFRLLIPVGSRFTTIWLLLRPLVFRYRHDWLLLRSILVRWRNVDVLRQVPISHQLILREVLRHCLVLVVQKIWSVHHVSMGWPSEVLVVSNVNLIHLLLMSLQGIHLGLILIISNRWRGVGSWFVVLNTLVLILHLLLDSTRHFIWVVVWKLGREHEASVAISGEWLLIVTDLIERKLHLGGNNKIVTVFDSHLGKTFGFSGNWLFSFNVYVHFFFLNKFPQFKVLDLSKDSLHQDLESLVGANLDIEGFVQFMVKFGSFNSNMETQVPSFFLSIGSFWVLGRTFVINHLIHLLNLSGLLGVQNLSVTWHHVLEMLRKALAHQALVVHSHHAVEVLKTLVIVSLPTI